MKIGNREFNIDRLIFFMNLISFILSILFYLKMFHQWKEAPKETISNSAIRDSIIRIDEQLRVRNAYLQQQQELILKKIDQQQQLLKIQHEKIKAVQTHIQQLFQSEWDQLSTKDKDQYIEKVILELKLSPD